MLDVVAMFAVGMCSALVISQRNACGTSLFMKWALHCGLVINFSPMSACMCIAL